MGDDNLLDMSDEDIDKMPMPEEPVQETEVPEEESTNKEEEPNGLQDTEEAPEEEQSEQESEEGDVEESEGEVEEEPTEEEDPKEEKEESETKEETTTPEETTATVDYEAEYKKLVAPFRANNKDMQVQSVDDARSLMQMGANYSKKMAGLKPSLKYVKMLQNNDLLDEEKLSYLIDLNKKNPEAIKKLLKDSGTDPLELDLDKATEYTPDTYTVEDKEVELDGVLDDIRDTTSFQETINIVSNKWDESSKRFLLDNPKYIAVINDQIGAGIFDQITSVIDYERSVGRLSGTSDLDAYKQVGDALQAQGKLGGIPPTTKATEKAPDTVKKAVDDPKLKNRKRAASSTKRASSSKSKTADYNPLSLSDEEFEKVAGSQLI